MRRHNITRRSTRSALAQFIEEVLRRSGQWKPNSNYSMRRHLNDECRMTNGEPSDSIVFAHSIRRSAFVVLA
jgi:hypothetical protein